MAEYDWPCIFRGEPTGQQVNCGCGIGLGAVYHCDNQFVVNQQCILRRGNRCGKDAAPENMQSCASCNLREEPTGSTPVPLKPAAVFPRRIGQGDSRPWPRPLDHLRPWKQNEKQGMVVVNANRHGFGDACLTAWIAEGSKDAPLRLVHYATGAKKELLELLGQEITGDPSGAYTTFAAYSKELKEAGSTPRVFQRGRHLGIHSLPKRPTARLNEADLQWAADAIGTRETVLLYPNTEYGSREWPAFYWLELADLLAQKNIPLAVGGGHLDLRYRNLRGFWGQPWAKTAALMQQARLVVGNDSGPAHIAGTLDVPTIALLGPSQPSMFIHLESVRCLQVSTEELSCAGCYFHPPFTKKCESGCLALAHLKPATVLAAIEEMLQ
jgi:hypothetical protein